MLHLRHGIGTMPTAVSANSAPHIEPLKLLSEKNRGRERGRRARREVHGKGV